ncbi:MAG: PfkB family carbohydrate kinase [Chloroflexota bacterium]
MTDGPGLVSRPGIPDYVLIGHVTLDVVGDGFVIGGTVTYAGLTAHALGRTVGAVTSAGPGLALTEHLPGIEFRIKPAPATTTFENVYHDGRRQQWIRAVASALDGSLVPPAWRSAPIVHLAPLAGEFGTEILATFKDCQLLGLTPQGWLRVWNDEGFVRRSAWHHPEAALAACDVVVLSEEDVEADWKILHSYAKLTRLLVVTRGARGCVVFDRGKGWRVPAFPVAEVDATGAGDVFAAAFFVGMARDGDPIGAAHYANCVASFAVEAPGTDGVPTPEKVAERLATSSPAVAVP